MFDELLCDQMSIALGDGENNDVASTGVFGGWSRLSGIFTCFSPIEITSGPRLRYSQR